MTNLQSLRTWLNVAVVSMMAVTVSACVAQQEPKAGDRTKPPATAAEAEAALAAAEAELDNWMKQTVAIAHPEQPAGPPPTEPPPAPVSVTQVAPKSPEGADPPRTYGQLQSAKQGRLSPCQRACRALASMKRAADRVCELTGESDERCQNVRTRVDAARRRVEARCSPCP